MSKLPKTWREWNVLMTALLALPQPVTKESISECIVSFGYNPYSTERVVIDMAEIIQRAFDTSTNEEVIDDQD